MRRRTPLERRNELFEKTKEKRNANKNKEFISFSSLNIDVQPAIDNDVSMKLYLVAFQDEEECTGHNLIEELVIADNEANAIERAWEKYYNSKGFAIKPKRENHYLSYITELDEVDGYEIKIGNKLLKEKC